MTSLECRIALDGHRSDYLNWVARASRGYDPLLAVKLVSRAETYLKSSGVSYSLGRSDGSPVLVIEPTSGSALNQFAFEMKRRYRASVQFDPKQIIESDALALVSTVINQGRIVGYTLDLPWSAVAESARVDFWENPEITHEVEHLAIYWLLEQRRDSPYYGFLAARNGIPGYKGPYCMGYGTWFHLSELRTFQAQVLAELMELQQLFRETRDPNAITLRQAHWRSIQHHLRMLGDLVQTVNAALKVVQPTQDWRQVGGRAVEGTLESSDHSVQITIPLARSVGADDQNNFDLLVRQRDTLLAVTRGLMERIQVVASEINAPTPTAVGVARLQVRLSAGQPQLFQPPVLKAP